jgi:hypothetical protein
MRFGVLKVPCLSWGSSELNAFVRYICRGKWFRGDFTYLLHPVLSYTFVVSVVKQLQAKYRIVVFPAASRPTMTMRISKKVVRTGDEVANLCGEAKIPK